MIKGDMLHGNSRYLRFLSYLNLICFILLFSIFDVTLLFGMSPTLCPDRKLVVASVSYHVTIMSSLNLTDGLGLKKEQPPVNFFLVIERVFFVNLFRLYKILPAFSQPSLLLPTLWQ